MNKFGIQLYSVRDYFKSEEGVKEAFERLSCMGYSSAHTAGTYDFISPEKFREYANKNGIEICGTHYDYNRIKNDIDGTIKYHAALGTKNVGIGGMPTPIRGDDEKIYKFIDEFNALAQIYSKYGYKLTYHNHAFEFRKTNDGKTVFDHLIDNLDPQTTSFVFDTYWAQYGGIDVRMMIERLSGRIDILHLKDMAVTIDTSNPSSGTPTTPSIAEIGAGNINFKDIIPLAEKCGVKYFVVEDDRCIAGRSLEYANRSAEYIRNNLLKH